MFLPANLTRLVIDPYREKCNTLTVVGGRTPDPLELSGPVVIGGLVFSELTQDALAAVCLGAKAADVCLRVPLGVSLPGEDVRVIRVAPLEARPGETGPCSAVNQWTS